MFAIEFRTRKSASAYVCLPCSLLMGPYKLHAALRVDVLCTRTHSDGFNGSDHPVSGRKVSVRMTRTWSEPKSTTVGLVEIFFFLVLDGSICSDDSEDAQNSEKIHELISLLEKYLEEIFLPQGYPESVSGDYLNTRLWFNLQVSDVYTMSYSDFSKDVLGNLDDYSSVQFSGPSYPSKILPKNFPKISLKILKFPRNLVMISKLMFDSKFAQIWPKISSNFSPKFL